jgi:hypothetical protein
MKLFSLNFGTLILRFYLLMAIVIGAFFIGIPALALLALPVFFVSMMGVKFASPRLNNKKKPSAQGAMSREPGQNFERAHSAH